jgi:hypothetical protein
MEADRVSIFLHNPETNELHTTAVLEGRELKIYIHVIDYGIGIIKGRMSWDGGKVDR